MAKQFASEYPRTDEGWVKFPSDSSYRKAMFPEEVNQHPAKANVYLVQSIIEYVSEPDEILMDIMAGTGTIMVGGLIGRSIICVEISEKFHNLQQAALIKLDTIAPGISTHVMLINLPCQTYLPIPDLAHHIIFSPQYANIIRKGKNYRETDKLTVEKMGSYDFTEYSKNPLNLGVMNDWVWDKEMEKVYSKCFQSIKPGGTMTLIVKDHMKQGERVMMSQATVDSCTRVGFELVDWFKWAAPGMAYTHIRRARGEEVVDDEDIIILRRPPK